MAKIPPLTAPEAHREACAAKGVRLVLDVDDDAGVVEADRQRMGQVPGNLLTSALRHTPPGRRVALGVARQGPGRVALRVADTGDGIAAGHLSRVFERFWRGDSARGRDHGGSGIGLTISRALVEAHGGMLTITPPPDPAPGRSSPWSCPPVSAWARRRPRPPGDPLGIYPLGVSAWETQGPCRPPPPRRSAIAEGVPHERPAPPRPPRRPGAEVRRPRHGAARGPARPRAARRCPHPRTGRAARPRPLRGTVAFVASWVTTLGIGGFDLDFWWELALLVVITLLGHWTEMRTLGAASSALDALAELLPDEAEKVVDGDTVTVSVSEPAEGDVVLVRSGPASRRTARSPAVPPSSTSRCHRGVPAGPPGPWRDRGGRNRGHRQHRPDPGRGRRG